ncbi:MAG: hypothetical protein K2I54_02960 [Muribaculaceae bacterium]|nr:hypothetical protein [Muribaculaceae bacterium]
MKKLNIYIFALLGIIGCALAACDDDDNVTVAKAVLASAPSLSFEGLSAQPQSILIYADADWYSEAPEYVTISPATGHGGTTEVTVSIADNMRDGALDNPRQIDILFRGTTKKSIATVTIFQSGDTYRGVADYSVFEVAMAPDKTAMVVTDVTVAEVFSNGFIASDATGSIYVMGKPEGAVKGAQGAVKGIKNSDDASYPYVQGEVFDASGATEVDPGEPVDITSNFGSFSSDEIKYISVEGHVEGSSILVYGQSGNMIVLDAVDGVNLGEYANHLVKLTGYYAGKSKDTHRVFATAIEDMGMYQIVYWSEDFEWLEPWSCQKPAGQTVETNNPDATAQQLGTNKVNIDGTDVTTYQALLAMGYEFPVTCHSSRGARPANQQVYLQRNYLKMGLTGYYSGLTLKPIETVPANEHVLIAFDWCSQRQGSGTWDPTKLVVVVKNGEEEVQFEVPDHEYVKDGAYYWTNARIDLGTILIDKNTKITIRNCDDQWPGDSNGALRWFIDNIKIIAAE